MRLDVIGVEKKRPDYHIPTTNSGYGVGQKDKYCTEETLSIPYLFMGG